MKIAFIGLGKMGSAIAMRFLEAGYDLTVFNRTPAKVVPFIEKGAHGGDSIASSVKSADVIFTCLLDDKAILEVTHELAQNILPDAIHVGLSTILPDTAQTLQEIHQQNQGDYLAAAVLGIPKVAMKGKLTTFCAGSEKSLQKVQKLLEVFSEQVLFLGHNIRAANIMKICMNYSLITTIELISELYVFAEKSGLDQEIVKTGLHQIYGHPGFKQYIEKISRRDFDDANFDVVCGNKDTSLFQEAFARVGVAPELANIVKSRFISALALGMNKKDWSCIYELVRSESGLNE